VLPKGRADIHRVGHSGVVVILSSYSACPRKEGHGDVVMRAWLTHADARNKTLAGKYIARYGFQLVEHTRDQLVVCLPAPAREDA